MRQPAALGNGVWDVEIDAKGDGGETYRKTFASS